MRLFVAVDLDEAARSAVARLQQELEPRIGADRALRWIMPERMHLTLVFLGEIAEERVAPLVGALSGPFDADPFPIALGGLGVFPSRRAPQVLWLGVNQGADQIIALQKLVADRLMPFGIERERRAFHPHLTLARWRGRPASRVATDLARATTAASAGEARLDIDHVTLYASRLLRAGPAYLALARATLT